MVIDTHCHLNDEKYEIDCKNIIENAKNDNLEAIIVCGANLETSKSALKLAIENNNVYAIIGTHPEDCEEYNKRAENFYIKNSTNPKVVAIGEIGLDYHYSKENVQLQKEVFVKQLKLANNCNLPVCIHLRDAYEDFLEIIEENKHLLNNGGVIHCFSGSLEYAKIVTRYGFKLGLDGPLTFKNNKKTQQIVKELDLNNFVVETDAPYLAPEPFRGTRNEPKMVNLVVQKIAELKQMPINKVEDILLKNTYELYGKLNRE